MPHKPTESPEDTLEAFLADAVLKAQLAADACVVVHRGASLASTPEGPSEWAPFNSREELENFGATLDQWLEKRASQSRHAA